MMHEMCLSKKILMGIGGLIATLFLSLMPMYAFAATTVQEAQGQALGIVFGILALVSLPFVAIIVVTCIAKMKALNKMGLPGISAWIPFWSDYLLWKNCEKDIKWFWILLGIAIGMCIPIVNFVTTIAVIVTVPVKLILIQSVVKVMGRGKWQVAWGLFGIVFWCMMGFSEKSQFQGFDNNGKNVLNTPPSGPVPPMGGQPGEFPTQQPQGMNQPPMGNSQMQQNSMPNQQPVPGTPVPPVGQPPIGQPPVGQPPVPPAPQGGPQPPVQNF